MLVDIGVSKAWSIDKDNAAQVTLAFATRRFQSDGVDFQSTRAEGVVGFHSFAPISIGGVGNLVEDVVYKLRGALSMRFREIEWNSPCSFQRRFPQ